MTPGTSFSSSPCYDCLGQTNKHTSVEVIREGWEELTQCPIPTCRLAWESDETWKWNLDDGPAGMACCFTKLMKVAVLPYSSWIVPSSLGFITRSLPNLCRWSSAFWYVCFHLRYVALLWPLPTAQTIWLLNQIGKCFIKLAIADYEYLSFQVLESELRCKTCKWSIYFMPTHHSILGVQLRRLTT